MGYLGFQHRFAPGMPLYMQVSRAGCVLPPSEHHGDACPGKALRIQSDALETFHRELEHKG